MKTKILIAVFLLLVTACSAKDVRKTIEIITASAEEVPLNKQEVAAALKDALSKGVAKGSIRASATNGYFKNPRLKIPFPPNVKKVEKTLRKLGLDKEVDQFVRQLNRAAEKAAIRAKPVFIKAITSMTIRDAFSILNGEQDSATRYLIRTTGDKLKEQFLPIVSDTLEEANATKYYGDIVNYYNQLPLVRKVDPDLDSYATDRAIQGLFVLIAEEETNIRKNPGARTTQLLRRVFGSLD